MADGPNLAAERPPVAADLCRGVARALVAADHAVLAEMPLGNGRRADLMAVGRGGEIVIVEVKSSRADFITDRKWREYLEFCDRFYFAVGSAFPERLLPVDEGLIRADPYGAEVARPAADRRLGAMRRKAMLIRFARVAAARLQALSDAAIDQARLF